jgi:hypothetical protein
MNDANDPLEAELAALRPHDPSPELRQRVGQRLTVPVRTGSRWPWGVALVAGLAAACVVAVLLRYGVGPGPAPTQTAFDPRTAGATEDSLPSIWVFQNALSRSPDELDAVLDRHGVRGPRPDPRGVGVYAFPRSDVEIRSLIGEP